MLKIAGRFCLQGCAVQCIAYGKGHINSTYLVTTDCSKKYILQRINKYVFKDPVAVVKNATAVTEHIRRSCQTALRFICDDRGNFCYKDDAGEYWRMYEFVEGFCMECPKTAEDVYHSACAFGRFQEQLADFPADSLSETIPNFHNTVDRYRLFKQSIAADKAGRLAGVAEEVAFYLAQEELGSRLQHMKEQGILPLRVTHNDTKINNVLLDPESHCPLCVLDLDTVMPGLSLYDFGDAIRSSARTGAEDEQDFSQIHLNLDFFKAYTRGYLESAPSLTDAEIRSLTLSAFTMTLECGCRFLTDYLDGDLYFRTAYPEHNLVRSRTHIALAKEILAKREEMDCIVQRIAADLRK